MTDLQIGLIAAGVVLVILVIAYNAWQRHRAKKHVEEAFPDPVGDALMDKDAAKAGFEKKEPVLDSEASPEEEKDDGSLSFRVKRLPLDDLIELPVRFVPEELLDAENVLPELQKLADIGGKPIRYLGLPVGLDETQRSSWQPVLPKSAYRQIKACTMLANRSGYLDEIQFSELMGRFQQIGVAIGAEPEIPDMSGVVEKARQLFEFVKANDAKLGISIRSNGDPWPMLLVKDALASQGLEPEADGVWVLREESDHSAVFTLTVNEPESAETAVRLTLLLDLPCVAMESDGYGRMVSVAKALCVRLDGAIIDDMNNLLPDKTIEAIRGQVAAFYTEMQGTAIPAGSIRALRLFA